MSKEAMKLALEALNNETDLSLQLRAIIALEKALAKQEQGEPYGILNVETGIVRKSWEGMAYYGELIDVYTTPPQRTWVGLTDEEINEAIKHSEKIATDYAGWVSEQRLIWGRSIEAKLKEKNT
jgi:hypothetical protein